MKAFFAAGYGGPRMMQLGDLPDPVPDSDQVLLRVRASSKMAA